MSSPMSFVMLRGYRGLLAHFRQNTFYKIHGQCLSSLTAAQVSNFPVEYPPVKPRRPPGDWGDMSDKISWLWFDEMEKMRQIQTIHGRIDHLTEKVTRFWDFPAFQVVPKTYDYQQYVTKTHVIQGLPGVYDDIDVDEEVDLLKPIIMEVLQFEKHFIDTHKSTRKFVWSWEEVATHFLLKQLLQTVLMTISHKYDHLLNSQIGENVKVKSFWYRYGFRRFLRKKSERQKYPSFEYQNNSMFQANHIASLHIETTSPLPEFVDREDELCVSGTYPEFPYYPSVVGQTSTLSNPAIVPDICNANPFTYGTMSVLNTNSSVIKRFERTYGVEKTTTNILGMGLAASFSSLVAQAHFKGFNTVLDLTSPLTTQTILSDGQTFTFMTYQLNTLHLWKDDDGNPLRNLCWVSGQHKLFELDNGNISNFNDDVLRMLIKFLVLQPVTRDTTEPSLPVTLPPDEYIKERRAVVIEEEEIIYDATR